MEKNQENVTANEVAENAVENKGGFKKVMSAVGGFIADTFMPSDPVKKVSRAGAATLGIVTGNAHYNHNQSKKAVNEAVTTVTGDGVRITEF